MNLILISVIVALIDNFFLFMKFISVDCEVFLSLFIRIVLIFYGMEF